MRRVLAFLPALAVALWAGMASANLLSPEDEKIYRTAYQAFHDDQAQAAQNTAARAQNRLLAKVLQWLVYTTPNSGALFADITGFITANPQWPQIPTLMRRAEESISVATPDSAVLAWFDSHPPLTVDGALAYGKALLAAGNAEKAEKLARQTWISGTFGPQQEENFLAAFQALLRDQDQVARLDRLLWERQDAAALLQMPRVDERYRLLAQARIALENSASNALALAARVAPELKNDPGLIYQLARYHRQHDEDDQAIELLRHPARNQGRPELWWAERSILARRALQQGKVTQAFEIASDHGLTQGSAFADAEWLSGWLALRYLDDREVALRHFTEMYQRVSSPQSHSRAAYWAGRAAEAQGRADEAARWYGTSAKYFTTFYGQLAAARLDRDQHWPLPSDPLPTAGDIQSFDQLELVRAARMLGEVNETDIARPFLVRVTELVKTPGQQALAANLATSLGRADIAVSVAKRAEREGTPMIASGYPLPAIGTGEKPEPALVLALIRQESAFHYQAISPVGARGLMQLMPGTAEKVARNLDLGFKKKDALTRALTSDPRLNVRLGSSYLDGLLSTFNGSYILSVAAYNAGPSRVKRWLQDNGDPRSPEVDPVDWIESIPYSETRNYVQRVLEGLQIYRRRLGATALTLSLNGDLKR